MLYKVPSAPWLITISLAAGSFGYSEPGNSFVRWFNVVLSDVTAVRVKVALFLICHKTQFPVAILISSE